MLGQSTQAMYPVDSTAPALTISSPPNNKFFGPDDLMNGAFQVCAQTPDKDATALPATLGAAVKNLSVAVGTGSPDSTNGYVAVTATNTDTCVNVACTSSTPVDLTVTLKDAAGNATTKTISQISCATVAARRADRVADRGRDALRRSDQAPAGVVVDRTRSRTRTASRPARSGPSSRARTRPAWRRCSAARWAER